MKLWLLNVGVRTTGNPSGWMLLNKVGIKAIGAYPKVDVGNKSYPEHSGWTDKNEVREGSYKGQNDLVRGAWILEKRG